MASSCWRVSWLTGLDGFHNDGQGVIRYNYLLHFLFGGFQFHLFAEFDGTEAIAISVVLSIRAEIPTPVPPPVTVTRRSGIIFHEKLSAVSCDTGNTVSLPFDALRGNIQTTSQ